MALPTSARQLSFAEVLKSYPARNPSETILYKVVQENLETFIQMTEGEPNRKGLPEYVKREFQEYLRCGILANGFLRLQCTSCRHERLVAFSCKGRGFCPSCGGRRMSELAAFLVDEVFPHVPIRQVVLSFPFPIRFWMAKNPKLQSAILTITIRAVSGLLRKKAKAIGLKQDLEYAVVTVIQRFGGSVNLNPHLHMLWVDGLYDVSGETGVFHHIAALTDEEVRTLVETLSQRILKSLKRKGYPVEEGADTQESADETLLDVQSASVESTIALGERRGKKVRRIGVVERGGFEGAILEGERCASYRGFSLHANVVSRQEERAKLEQMVRYIARPPIAIDRLTKRADGLITYRMKKKYRDGTEMLLFSGLELMEKLAALVPRPRAHITRYHGLFAPHSKNRKKVVLRETGRVVEVGPTSNEKKINTEKRMSWARLMNRVFKIDVTECRFCHSEVKVIAAVLERNAIVKILNHLGLPTEPPVIHPARPPPQGQFDGFSQIPSSDYIDF